MCCDAMRCDAMFSDAVFGDLSLKESGLRCGLGMNTFCRI
jgi:hypothetical protein